MGWTIEGTAGQLCAAHGRQKAGRKWRAALSRECLRITFINAGGTGQSRSGQQRNKNKRNKLLLQKAKEENIATSL
ncbi:hypothetical protein PoB_002028400 [Plakobranchus ocellatus]|uniref:Uncharacterized protein n=1 Tax=Plakobranchus ocellatus TaxID=259542 RepID=A0AAV3ZEH0_9GAST|nr:hypothetical protein PoB_002028400 [Plakobranchus ocellatus]